MRSIPPIFRLATALALLAGACSISQPVVTAEPSTTTSLPSGPTPSTDLTLTSDAIGPFAIGDDAETVIAGIAAAIGGWDADSREDASTVAAPECPSGAARVVSWGSLALVFIADVDGERLASWSYGFDPVTANSVDLRNSNLRTREGVGLGSTRRDLVDSYGARVSVTDAYDIASATFVVDGSSDPHMVGKLDAPGDSGVVDFIAIEPTC